MNASADVLIPIGTESSRAIDMMEKEGFSARIIENGRFKAQVRDSTGQVHEREITGVTHIRCSNKLGHAFSLVTSVKCVFLVLDENRCVRETYERIDHTGF